ncbi:hypothetical protein [Ekhidna sp.]|uniref:hypothetical protein n=1 Tax=Ekhidna sp. TaxID=2608089 RepID=UPI00329790FC
MNKKKIVHRAPTPTTKKQILAASGNQCAFPTCNDIIVDREHGVLVGKIAHIKARREEGPRFDYNQSEKENRSAENLLALCGKHHDIVDDRTDIYNVESLISMKHNHEEKIENSADRSWIRFPNFAVQQIEGVGPIKIDFWVDRDGRAQVYSDRKLAIARTVLDIYDDLNKICKLYEMAEQNPEVPSRNLFQGNTRLNKERVKLDPETKWSAIAHLFVQMAEIPEITFGELLAYNILGGDVTPLLTNRAEILENKIKEIRSEQAK